VDARARKAQDKVSWRNVCTVERFPALDGSDAETGKVVVAKSIHSGHLGGFSANEGAAGLPAAFGDRFDHFGRDLGVELSSRIIIEEEEGFCALDNQVVRAHRNEVDPDALVPGRLDRKLELCPDPVVGCDQQWVLIAGGLQIEKPAEPTQLGVCSRPRSCSGKRTNGSYERISSVDGNSGIGIGEGLLAHSPAGSRDKPLGFPRRCRQKTMRMLRRPLVIPVLLLLAALGLGVAVYAQLDSTDRGILPLDTSNTLEIDGIHVDVGANDAQSARLDGWRLAQRQGFRALWAKMHHAPIGQAPNLPDTLLDQIVSSINVDREEIGPNRYVADLRIEFDRSRAAPFLGVEGSQVTERSVPMLLIPVTVTAGTETSVELRNMWQRAWAQFRTAQTPIDYVRVSGMGSDPMLVNAAQASRPGRGWWRALLDMYGAQDVLVAEVQLQHAYPGGPARARFIARHGPDNEIVGGFTLTAPNSDAVPAMMAQGAQRIDNLFAQALASGRLARDPSLNIPTPPVQLQLEPQPVAKPVNLVNAYQVQIVGNDVNIYNFAMAHLRTIGGVDSATPQQINPNGTSYVLVAYRGTIAQLTAALRSRGWIADFAGTVVRIHPAGDKPPALPTPTPPPQAVAPAPAPVTQNSGDGV
jgi:hypothetical protein